jgi:hypothetical protein
MSIPSRTYLQTRGGRIIAEIIPGESIDVSNLDFSEDGSGAIVPPPVLPRSMALPEPDALELAANLGKATAGWAAAGFPVVTQAQYDARTVACTPCDLWDGSARLGLGKCKAPGCGCTKFKRWLATEVCKHPQGSKWPASVTVLKRS